MSSCKVRRVGLIGWPVERSLSPAIQNAAFSALGLDWRYELWPIAPADLADGLRRLVRDGIAGANVTVPHKVSVLPLLDEIDPVATAIGAVNTIVRRGDRLIGHNTDAAGFIGALRSAGFEPRGARAVILGAGGAARAVAYGLATNGATQITVCNRSAERAKALCTAVSGWGTGAVVSATTASDSALADVVNGADLLVNATTVGMWPEVEACPWPESVALLKHLTVCDLVYKPPATRLLQRAREAGCRTVDGLGMLVGQAALAFELWTGREAPVDIMIGAARESHG